MKKTILIIFLTSAYLFSYCQKVELTKKEVQTIKVLRATLFLKNKHGALYLDKQDYVFERTSEGDLLMYSKTNPGLSDPLIGDRYHRYLIKVNGSQLGIVECYEECERKAFINIMKWDGDRPLNTGSRVLEDGDWVYDTNGNVKELKAGLSYKRSGKKKVYRDTKITFGYDEEGRINQANKIVQVYQKSTSSKNLRKDYLLTERTINSTYKKNSAQLKIVEYKQGKKGSEEHKITEHTLTQEGLQTIDEKSVTTRGSKGEHVYGSLVRNEYDSNWKLVKKYSDEPDYTRTTDYTHDVNGYVIMEIKKTIRKADEITIRHITLTNKYDNKGLLKEQISLEKKEDGSIEKKITSHEYSAMEAGVPITRCQNKKESITRFYDQADVLYREVKGAKFRVREGGQWSEWKFFRM